MNKVCIKINGHEYNMCGSETKEHMLKIGSFVDEKMQEVIKSNHRLSTAMAAVLTSLNIANELFKKKDELDSIASRIKVPLEEIEAAHTVVEKMGKSLDEKQQTIDRLETEISSYDEKLKQYQMEVQQLEQVKQQLLDQMQEKEKKVMEAEEIVTDFQNRLYQLQMKVVHLEKEA